MLRRVFTLVPLALIGASAALLFFVNLSGVSNDLTFLNKFYFSSVTTTEEVRWTMYAMCAPTSNGDVYCSNRQPAYPYLPSDNFGLSSVPEEFVKNRNTYYYLLRIAYAWFLLALMFSLLSLFPVLWSCCFKGFITGFFASLVVGTAFFFAILGAAFNTGVHAKGVAVFKEAGYVAELGKDMMVAMWLSVALLLIATLWMFFIGIHAAHEKFGFGHKEKEVVYELDSE